MDVRNPYVEWRKPFLLGDLFFFGGEMHHAAYHWSGLTLSRYAALLPDGLCMAIGHGMSIGGRFFQDAWDCMVK